MAPGTMKTFESLLKSKTNFALFIPTVSENEPQILNNEHFLSMKVTIP